MHDCDREYEVDRDTTETVPCDLDGPSKLRLVCRRLPHERRSLVGKGRPIKVIKSPALQPSAAQWRAPRTKTYARVMGSITA